MKSSGKMSKAFRWTLFFHRRIVFSKIEKDKKLSRAKNRIIYLVLDVRFVEELEKHLPKLYFINDVELRGIIDKLYKRFK